MNQAQSFGKLYVQPSLAPILLSVYTPVLIGTASTEFTKFTKIYRVLNFHTTLDHLVVY